MQSPDDALTIKVVLPERNLRTALRVQSSQKLSDVVTLLCSKFSLAPAEDYALFHATAGAATRLEAVRVVSSFNFPNLTELILRRFQFRVTILMPHVLPEDQCVDMIEPPDIRVEQLLAHTIQLATRKNPSINYQHHGLYLPLARKPGAPLDATAEAIPMEGQRTLQSYRLRPEDQLIFRDRSQDIPKMERLGKHLQKAAPGNLFVVIESSVHGCSKIYGFPPNTTVGEVAHTFSETNPVTDIQEYGLFVKATGVRMEALHRLSSFPLKTLDTLVFRRLEESDVARLKGEVENDVSPNDVFGTDPSSLPKLLDYGLEVPAVLAVLRQELMHHNGLDQQGVFRLGGEERKMVKMQKELNKGQFVQYSTTEEDVFGVAALIKRWFGELPVRIFEVFPLKRLDRAAESQAQALAIIDELREPHRSIFMWFLYLLVDAATRRATTLMDCNNLAIVAAPVLTSIPLTNPMEGLIMTQRVTQIVRQALEFYLAKAESGQLENLKAPAAQPIPPPASSPTASSAPVPIDASAQPASDAADSPTRSAPAIPPDNSSSSSSSSSAPSGDNAAMAAALTAAALNAQFLESRLSQGRQSSPGGGRKESSPWKRVTHADSIVLQSGAPPIATTSRMSSYGGMRSSAGGSEAQPTPASGSSSPLAVPIPQARSVPSPSTSPSTSPRGLSPGSSSPRLMSYPTTAPLPPESAYRPATSSDASLSPPSNSNSTLLYSTSTPTFPSFLNPDSSHLVAPASTPFVTPRKDIVSVTLQQLMSTQEFFPPTDSPPVSPRAPPVIIDPSALPPAPVVPLRASSPRSTSPLLVTAAPPPPPIVGRNSQQGDPASGMALLPPSPRPGQQPYLPLFVPPRSPPPTLPAHGNDHDHEYYYNEQVHANESNDTDNHTPPSSSSWSEHAHADLPPPDLDAPPAPPLSPGRVSPSREPPAAAAPPLPPRDQSPAPLSPRLRTVIIKSPLPGAPRSMTPSGVKKYPTVPAPSLRSNSAPTTPIAGSPALPSPLAAAEVASASSAALDDAYPALFDNADGIEQAAPPELSPEAPDESNVGFL